MLREESNPSSDPIHTNLDDDEDEPEKIQPETFAPKVNRRGRGGGGGGKGRGKISKNNKNKNINNGSSDSETPVKIPKKRPYVKSPKKDRSDEKSFEDTNSPSPEAVVSPTGRTKR